MFIIRDPNKVKTSIEKVTKAEPHDKEDYVTAAVHSTLGLSMDYENKAKELNECRVCNYEEFIQQLASLVKRTRTYQGFNTDIFHNVTACENFIQLIPKQILEMEVIAVGSKIANQYRQVYMLNPVNHYIYVVVAQSWNGKPETAGDFNVGSYVFYCVIIGKAINKNTPNEGDKTYNVKLAKDLAYNFAFSLSYNESRYWLLLSDKNIDKKIRDIGNVKSDYILLEHILYEQYTGQDISTDINKGYQMHHDQYRFDLREGNILLISKDEHESYGKSSHNYSEIIYPLAAIPLYHK